jgi:hypothetical protein
VRPRHSTPARTRKKHEESGQGHAEIAEELSTETVEADGHTANLGGIKHKANWIKFPDRLSYWISHLTLPLARHEEKKDA